MQTSKIGQQQSVTSIAIRTINIMAYASNPSVKVLVLAAATVLVLLTSYLWLIPMFPLFKQLFRAISGISLLACFVGSAIVSWQSLNEEKIAVRAILGIAISAAVTIVVFAIYLIVATKLRGS